MARFFDVIETPFLFHFPQESLFDRAMRR